MSPGFVIYRNVTEISLWKYRITTVKIVVLGSVVLRTRQSLLMKKHLVWLVVIIAVSLASEAGGFYPRPVVAPTTALIGAGVPANLGVLYNRFRVVPEPITLILLGTALAFVGIAGRRLRKD